MAKYKKTYKDPRKKPITVYDKNDPRLLAYNDSLSYYNNYIKELNSINPKEYETIPYFNVTNSYKTLGKNAQGKEIVETITTKGNTDYIKPIAQLSKKLEFETFENTNQVDINGSDLTVGSKLIQVYKKPEQPVEYVESRKPQNLTTLKTIDKGFDLRKEEPLATPSRLATNDKYKAVYSKHPADIKQYGSKGKFLHYAEQDEIGNWHPLKETLKDLNTLEPVEKLKYGGSMKYRKYGNMKSYKFGDFLQDYGKLMLNTAATPLETVVGRNFYDPEFNGHAFDQINNVTSGLMAAGTDVAGSIALGPAYGAGKQALQLGVNTLDPEGKLNQTRTMKYGGALTSFKGNSHEDGGIKMPDINTEVEDGESLNNDSSYVYSDSITFDDDLAKEFGFKKAKGKTISGYAKKIDKMFSREDDLFDKKSKAKMLDRLTEAQESFKMENFSTDFEDKYKKKMGGHLYKMALGGYTGDPVKTMTSTEYLALYPDSSLDDYEKYYKSIVPELSNATPKTFLEDSDIYNGTPVDFKGLPATSETTDVNTKATTSLTGDPLVENVNINPLYDVARMAPMIANFASGLKTQKLDNNKYRTKGRVTAPEFNIDPLLQDNRSSYAKGLDMIKANSGGNAGTYLSNISSINSAKGRLDSKAYTDKFNLDSQNKFRADQMNIGIEQGNNQMDFQVDDWNARSSEQGKNLQRKAASDLANLSQVKMEEALMESYIDATSDNYDYNFTRYIPKSKRYNKTYGK